MSGADEGDLRGQTPVSRTATSVGSGAMRRLTLYTAAGCHLCDRARATVEGVRAEIPFELEEIDITGDAELERRYRERLPVVELDGEHAFAYHVPAGRLRAALRTKLPA
jgi:glutaredoxin